MTTMLRQENLNTMPAHGMLQERREATSDDLVPLEELLENDSRGAARRALHDELLELSSSLRQQSAQANSEQRRAHLVALCEAIRGALPIVDSVWDSRN